MSAFLNAFLQGSPRHRHLLQDYTARSFYLNKVQSRVMFAEIIYKLIATADASNLPP